MQSSDLAAVSVKPPMARKFHGNVAVAVFPA